MLEPDTLVQGRYRIIRHLREGGMGSVYEAHDMRLGNRVALKRASLREEDIREAFRLEARILSALRHPALPVVIDYFSEAGEDYLVMDYVDGDDFSDLLRRSGGPLAPGNVLAWADRILDALVYLHERGVIHRDIKPANLKLTPKKEVILLDFGISKGSPDWQGTNRSILSGGTNGYSPLEQLMDLGTDERSDVFSLAVTVYELLTFQLPPDARLRAKAIVVRKPDPIVPADRHNPNVPPAVAAALGRALALERDDRTPSARDFRDELARAAVVEAGAGTPLPAPRRIVVDLPTPEPVADGPRARNLPTVRFTGHGRVTSAAFAPDGRTAFSGGDEGEIRIWDVWDGRELGRLEGHAGAVHGIAVSADGVLLVTCGADAAVRVWEVTTGRELARLDGHASAVRAIALAPDGRGAVSGDVGGRVVVWDLANVRGEYRIDEPGGVNAVAISPDGKLALAAGDSKSVAVWELESGREVSRNREHRQLVYSAVFSPDSTLVASGGGDATVRIHDPATGTERLCVAGHRSAARSVAFSADGRHLLSGSIGGVLRVWDAAKGTERAHFEGEMGLLGVGSLAPDHRLVFAYSASGSVRFWDPDRG